MPWYGTSTGSGGTGGGGFNVKGSVPTASALPTTGATNDAYLVQDTGHLWTWNGTKFVDAGNISGPTGPRGAQGLPGADGVTPLITNGSITALASDQAPTAQLTETAPHVYRFDIAIPVGAKGEPGQAILSGRGAPNASTPGASTGALYLDLNTYDLYKLS